MHARHRPGHALTGALDEDERRLVAAAPSSASGSAAPAAAGRIPAASGPASSSSKAYRRGEGDPEFGISRGRLLPNHQHLQPDEVPHETREKLQESLVLVHGGMAQNVGPSWRW